MPSVATGSLTSPHVTDTKTQLCVACTAELSGPAVQRKMTATTCLVIGFH